MRHTLHGRVGIQQRLQALAQEMAAWAQVPRVDEDEAERLRAAITPFRHTTEHQGLTIGGVDGSGDYPSISYGDSFVYVTVAHGTRYRSDPLSGLKEEPAVDCELVEFSWIPEDDVRRAWAIDSAFERLAGQTVEEVIDRSDYRTYKDKLARRSHAVAELKAELIRPHAADAGNLAIQLRSVGELSAALRLIEADSPPSYVLYDSTFSLPFVARPRSSLFLEHLKRLCCVRAREKGIAFVALSKSHGLPAVDRIEDLAKDAVGTGSSMAEHWFLRMPTQARDGWEMKIVETRNVPPPGAVSYLVRFHRNVPVMRLDVDEVWWSHRIAGESEEETRRNEQRLFEDLDYASHDQRAFGYPYPIKAGHDRASLTEAERVALRKMIIDSAVQAGMSRNLFRSVSAATGHG